MTLEIDWSLSSPCYGGVTATAVKARVLNVAGSLTLGPLTLRPSTPSVVTAIAAVEANLPPKIGTVPLLPMPGQLPYGLWLAYLGKDSTDQAVRFAWNVVDVMPSCTPPPSSPGCGGTTTPPDPNLDYDGPGGFNPYGGLGQGPGTCSGSTL